MRLCGATLIQEVMFLASVSTEGKAQFSSRAEQLFGNCIDNVHESKLECDIKNILVVTDVHRNKITYIN